MRGGRSSWAWMTLTAVSKLSPGGAMAQATVFAGAAAAIPLADLGAIADLGFQGFVGGTVEVGTAGFALGATGFFGNNPHELAGESSDLYGATVLAGYTIAEPYGLRARVWAGVGGMVHALKSDTFPGLNTTQRGLTLSAGGSVSRPVGRVGVFVSGLYTRGLGDLGTSSYPTELVTLGGGVSIPLSID